MTDLCNENSTPINVPSSLVSNITSLSAPVNAVSYKVQPAISSTTYGSTSKTYSSSCNNIITSSIPSFTNPPAPSIIHSSENHAPISFSNSFPPCFSDPPQQVYPNSLPHMLPIPSTQVLSNPHPPAFANQPPPVFLNHPPPVFTIPLPQLLSNPPPPVLSNPPPQVFSNPSPQSLFNLPPQILSEPPPQVLSYPPPQVSNPPTHVLKNPPPHIISKPPPSQILSSVSLEQLNEVSSATNDSVKIMSCSNSACTEASSTFLQEFFHQEIKSDKNTSERIDHSKLCSTSEVNQLGNKIIISNIPLNITDEDLKNLLMLCGKLVKFSRTNTTKFSFGVATFENENNAITAIRLLNKLSISTEVLEVISLNPLNKPKINTADFDNLTKKQRKIQRCIEKYIKDKNLEAKNEQRSTDSTEENVKKSFKDKDLSLCDSSKDNDDLIVNAKSVSSIEDVNLCSASKQYLKRLNKKDSRLSHMFISCTLPCRVGVYNISKFVTLELFEKFASTINCEIKPALSEGIVILSFSDNDVGRLVSNALSNYRCIDTFMKTTLSLPSNVNESLLNMDDEEEVESIKNIMDSCLRSYEDDIVKNIQLRFNKELDISTFKTEKCNLKCGKKYNCKYYHSDFDRRRNPLLYSYKDLKCFYEKCEKGDNCKFSHNTLERILHPNCFRTVICDSWRKSQPCLKKPFFCSMAHPETPDVLFSKLWTDLFLAGIGNSLKFVFGTVRHLYRLPDLEGLKVLVLSSSVGFVRIAVKSVADVAKDHDIMLAGVISGNQDPSGSDMIIATVFGLINVIKNYSDLSFKNVSAIVVDDIFSFTNNPTSYTQLKEVLLFLKHKTRFDRTNKVITAELAKLETVLETEKLFDTCFERLHRQQNWKILLKDKPCYTASAGSSSSKKRKLSDGSFESAAHYEKDDTNTFFKEVSKFSIQGDLSLKSDSRSCTPVFSQTKASFQKFIEDLESEYKVFLEIPELHPQYEDKYEVFLNSVTENPEYDDAENLQEQWKRFWCKELEDLKANEITKRKLALASITQPKEDAGFDPKYLVLYSIPAVLDLLEELIPVLGIMGPAVAALVQRAVQLGVTTKKALEFYQASEAIDLLLTVTRKLTTLKKNANEKEAEKFEKAKAWIYLLCNKNTSSSYE